MTGAVIAVIAVAVILLGLFIFPFINKLQFNKMPEEHKVRILMKEAKGLIYFKNVSDGRSGKLYYVKNKRKIYVYPWVLDDGKMRCTRKALFTEWDYPEEKPAFTDEERIQALSELENYNKKNRIKLYFDEDIE